ncbi:MAG: hemolysin family protein [Candidatus Babeliales bacterium]
MQPDSYVNNFMYTEFIAFVISLMACALFSFLETTVTALRLFKLKELATTTPRYQALFKTLEERPQQVLISILIASSLANVTAAALITNIMENIFTRLQLSGGLGFSLGIGIATSSILIFGEVIPKNFAKIYGERLFKSTLWFTNIIFYILYPFVTLLIRFSSLLVSFVGGSTIPTESVVSEREIRFLIDYINEKGLMEREKTAMLQSIFKLGSKQAKEIMVPAIDIVMLDVDSTIKQSFDVFSEYQFSRLPVYRESKDNIIGMVLQKDIFVCMTKDQEKPLEDLIRPILFVPESMKINQLLREFRQNRMHIALVLNEYGSITGLATLEDILEEIVGEIRDEYEAVPEKIIPLKESDWLVDGSVDLDSLARVLDITFDVETAVTIGGFLTEQLQHLPKTGERILYKGYYFHVQQASPKRVLQVRIFQEKNDQET